MYEEFSTSFSLSQVIFVALLSSLPRSGGCAHGCSGEEASKNLFAEILHCEAGNTVLGASQLLAYVQLLPHRLTAIQVHDSSGNFDKYRGEHLQ
jgi:hypothetical protein